MADGASRRRDETGALRATVGNSTRCSAACSGVIVAMRSENQTLPPDAQTSEDLKEACDSLRISRSRMSSSFAFADAALELAYQDHAAFLALVHLKSLSILAVVFAAVVGIYQTQTKTYEKDQFFISCFAAGTISFALLLHCAPTRLLVPLLRWRQGLLMTLSVAVLLVLTLPVIVHGPEAHATRLPCASNSTTCLVERQTIVYYFVSGSWISSSYVFCVSLVCVVASLPPVLCISFFTLTMVPYALYIHAMLSYELGTSEPIVLRLLPSVVPSCILALVASTLHIKLRRESFLMVALMRNVKDKRIMQLERKTAVLECMRDLRRFPGLASHGALPRRRAATTRLSLVRSSAQHRSESSHHDAAARAAAGEQTTGEQPSAFKDAASEAASEAAPHSELPAKSFRSLRSRMSEGTAGARAAAVVAPASRPALVASLVSVKQQASAAGTHERRAVLTADMATNATADTTADTTAGAQSVLTLPWPQRYAQQRGSDSAPQQTADEFGEATERRQRQIAERLAARFA